jgi:hypothetical protein
MRAKRKAKPPTLRASVGRRAAECRTERCRSVAAREWLPLSRGGILHHLKLDLLDFGQPLPLAREDVVDLLVQVPDFQFGFQFTR